MLLKHGFLERFLAINSVLPKLTGELFAYDQKLDRVKVTNSKFQKHGFLLRSIIYSLLAAGYLLKIAYIPRNIEAHQNMGNRMIERSECIMMFTILSFFAHFCWNRVKSVEDLVIMLNGLIQMEKGASKGVIGNQLSVKAKIALIISDCTTKLFVPLVPIAVATSCSMNPCLAFNVINAFKFCACASTNSFVKSIAIFLINYVFWLMIWASGHCMIMDILFGTVCLTNCVLMTGKKMNMITALNYTATADMSKSIRCSKALQSFREIHVLCHCYNQIVKFTLFSFLITICTVQIISAGIMLTPFGIKIPIPLTLFFAGGLIEAMNINIVLYGFAADLSYTSHRMLGSLTRNRNVMQNKFLKRFIKSCPILRVEIGVSNYVDKTTPLVCQKFCFDRIVDFLLVGKDRHMHLK